jgi:hypothetical protein
MCRQDACMILKEWFCSVAIEETNQLQARGGRRKAVKNLHQERLHDVHIKSVMQWNQERTSGWSIPNTIRMSSRFSFHMFR